MMATATYTDPGLYRRLLRQARPYWPHIAGIFLVSLLSTPLKLLTPVPLKIAVDSVIGSHPLPAFLGALLPTAATRSDSALLAVAAGLLVAVALVSGLQNFGGSLLRKYTGEKLVLTFRAKLFRHAQRLSLSYHDAKGTGDSMYRIQSDARAIQSIAIDGIIPFIVAGFTLVSMLYIIVRLDWQLGLLSLVIAPVFFALVHSTRGWMRRQSRAVKKLESSALSVVQEVLSAIRVVKAFAQEDREQERFVRHHNEGMWARLRLSIFQGTYKLVVGLTTAIATAAFLFIGIRHVQSGTLTLGELILVLGYLAQFIGPLKQIGSKVVSLQSSLVSAERAFSLLDEAPDVRERPNARPLLRASGSVAFRDVCFAYDKDPPVLQDISFEIDAGTRLGIMGMTGAGKTTLVSLLTRFYDPISGQILLDGIDLHDFKLADLRNQFAIVLQEPVLFSNSIAENIAYARPGASDQEITAAATAANAHDFIHHLPEGYDTLVGQRGMRLSGGERQRIALARAFLKDAPILILDEPTSSVDLKTETAIFEAMDRLMRGRTTFMIAHRLSTLENCDFLLVIERGQLVAVKSDVAKTIGKSLSVHRQDIGLEGGKAYG